MKMTDTLRKSSWKKKGGVWRTTNIMTSRLLALTAALTLITIGAHAQQGYVIVSVNSGLVLDVPAWSTQPGTLMQQWPENDGANQLWTITANGAGTYAIVSVNSGLVLDVPAFSTDPGTLIQ